MDTLAVLGDVDAMDTMGFAPFDEQNRLLGDVMELGAADKRKAVAKIMAPRFGSANLSARDKTMQRLGGLPEEIRRALAQKKLQLVDTEIYAVRFLKNLQDVRFFEPADNASAGIRNISNGKLGKDTFFLCTEIQFTVGLSAAATAEGQNPSDTFFDNPALLTTVANGEFDFKANGAKYIMPKDSPISMFSDIQFGGLKGNSKFTKTIENPKWIEPQVGIEFNTRFAAAVGATNHWGKVKLIGCSVIPY